MSYVRWSTPVRLPEGVDALDYYENKDRLYQDVPTSDLYIYASVGGFYSVNVAGNRHRPKQPFYGEGDWFAWLETDREDIDHPDAGETFEFATMSEVIEKVEQLQAAGFLVPDYLLPELRLEEAEEANNTGAKG